MSKSSDNINIKFLGFNINAEGKLPIILAFTLSVIFIMFASASMYFFGDKAFLIFKGFIK